MKIKAAHGFTAWVAYNNKCSPTAVSEFKQKVDNCHVRFNESNLIVDPLPINNPVEQFYVSFFSDLCSKFALNFYHLNFNSSMWR
jgi:hypothetical protein